MDTPFDQKVPVPPEFRPQRPRRSFVAQTVLRGQSLLSPSYTLAFLFSFLVAYIAYSSYEPEVTARIGRFSWTPLHSGIATDVEEARIYMQQLQQKLSISDTNCTLPSLPSVLDKSASTILAATSFVACHDKLTLDLGEFDCSHSDCFALFEKALECHGHFVKFHEHHKNITTTCKVGITGELESEIGRIRIWEQQRAESTLDRVSSVSTFLGDWKRMFSWQNAHEVVQNHGDHQEGRRAALMKAELEKDIERVQALRILHLAKDGCRQRIRDQYDRVIDLFVDAGCRMSGTLCECKDVDFESLKDTLGQVAPEVGHLAYRVPIGVL